MDAAAHAAVERHVTRLAERLGPVEGNVRVLQQVAGGLAVAGRDADARRDGERPVLGPDLERRLQLCEDPRRHEAAPRREPVVLEQDHELVAAQASDGVALPHRVLQPVAHGLEELVADGVAEGVVHILEVVEIDDEHGRDRAAATGACEQLVGAVEDEPAVWEPGQLVVQRLSDQLVRLLVDEVERAGSRRAERERSTTRAGP